MLTSSHPFLEVTEMNDAIVVQFLNRKVLNDDRLEAMAQQLFDLTGVLGKRTLRLDFANVEYLQSSVLGKLISLNKKAATNGGRLILANVRDDVYKAFTVTSLDKLFAIERMPSSEPEA